VRPFVTALLLALVLVPAALGAPARVAIFYYPWWGTPAADGAFQHWQQRGTRPPRDIASAFYPARGIYSSSDRVVLGAQMAEIRAAGVRQVISSWWGRGSPEDERLPWIAGAARAAGLELAAHLEPYGGRTPAATEADIGYLRGFGIVDFYLYGAHDEPASAWSGLNARLSGVRVFAQTGLVGFAAAGGFDGIYTYDVLVYGGGSFARICTAARRLGLVCAPSVGPGFDARRAAGIPRVKPRRNGATYDAMWAAALRARPERVTITSYNEWHEGTQIEPARARVGRNGLRYAGYDGAWGRTGAPAERAYLDRTVLWADRFTR